MLKTRFVVVGAGLAGLAAAATLRAAGETPLVLEANARIGGRVDTLRDDTGRALADLGPNWVWPPFQPGIARWLDHLGVSPLEQFEQGNAVLDGFAEAPIQQPLPGQHGMVRLSGGVGQIVQNLAARLPGDAIRCEAPVRAITEHASGGLLLTTDHHAPLLAEHVLIAAPLRVIAERIRLPETLPGALPRALAAMPTWMAAQAKAVIRYDRAFWREAGLSGRIASRRGPLFEAHDHTSADGDPALFGFIATPPDHRDPALLHDAILAQLERCFGAAARQPQALHIRDWATEPWICSTADRNSPPEHPAPGPSLLREGHLGGRLWLCCAETATQSPGLIEGALLAGEGAATNALAAAGDTPTRRADAQCPP